MNVKYRLLVMQRIFRVPRIKKRITLKSCMQERGLIPQHETWDLMTRIPIADSETVSTK